MGDLGGCAASDRRLLSGESIGIYQGFPDVTLNGVKCLKSLWQDNVDIGQNLSNCVECDGIRLGSGAQDLAADPKTLHPSASH